MIQLNTGWPTLATPDRPRRVTTLSISGLGKQHGAQNLFVDATINFNAGSRYGVVGANGSGKSNFFAAIQFVLDTGSNVLRAEDRKALLHEGVGTHVLSAFVEIILDNTERRMPIDKDEVVIRRAIGLKKDEYFIERKHCSKSELIALLETSPTRLAASRPIAPIRNNAIDRAWRRA